MCARPRQRQDGVVPRSMMNSLRAGQGTNFRRAFEMAEPETQLASARLMTVEAVASMLAISTRHVYRLADSGRMPRPVKLGGANRWNRDTLEAWINDGCPEVHAAKRTRRH